MSFIEGHFIAEKLHKNFPSCQNSGQKLPYTSVIFLLQIHDEICFWITRPCSISGFYPISKMWCSTTVLPPSTLPLHIFFSSKNVSSVSSYNVLVKINNKRCSGQFNISGYFSVPSIQISSWKLEKPSFLIQWVLQIREFQIWEFSLTRNLENEK